MPHKTTVTCIYYAQLLNRLRKTISEKRRDLTTEGVLLLHYKAQVQKSLFAQAAVQLPPYSPYSPYLALANCEYYLFSNLKESSRGRRFKIHDKLKLAVFLRTNLTSL